MRAEQESETRWQIVIAGFVILSALAALPVLAVNLPPLLDYPNHLARAHVLSALPASADLARYYVITWSPIPDLALDAVVPRLAQVMPVADVMRLFLGLIGLSLAGGCVALHRTAFGRWSLWPLCGFLLLYNRMLLWGFLNYLAGLGLALWGIAAWIALERRNLALRLAIGGIFSTTVYLAHLAAFGCYAVAIVAYSLSRQAGEPSAVLRRAVPALVTLLPALALFLLSPTSGAPSGIGYGNPLRKFDLPVSIFDNYNRVFDGTTFAVLLIAIIAGLARSGIVLEPRLRWSVLALVVVFFLLPSRFMGTAGLDHRLPTAIAFLLVGAADWSGLALRRRRQVGLFLFGLFAVRLAVVGGFWVHADRTYDALTPVFELIPEGGRLAVATPARAVQAGGVPLLHFPALAAAWRDAFVPTLFADPAQQPIRFTAEASALAAEASPTGLWDSVARGVIPALPGYDALMIIDPPRPLDPRTLPGPILFDQPRLILIGLPRPATR